MVHYIRGWVEAAIVVTYGVGEKFECIIKARRRLRRSSLFFLLLVFLFFLRYSRVLE